MRLVLRTRDAAQIAVGESVLRHNGIACMVKQDLLNPWLHLWVTDPDDEAQAKRLLAAMKEADETPQRLRLCPACGAEIEGPFDACWNCGADLPAG